MTTTAIAGTKEITGDALTAQRTLTVSIGRTKRVMFTLAEASKVYREHIEANDLGASNAPVCKVKAGGKIIATVSYNGRVWEA